MVMHKGEGDAVHMMHEEDIDMEFDVLTDDGQKKVIKRHIVINSDGDSALTGHTDVIVKMIERGEFTQDELDKIQAAIDVKR